MKLPVTPLLLLLTSCEGKAPETMTLTIDFANPAHIAVLLLIYLVWTFIVHTVTDNGGDAADGFMGFIMLIPGIAFIITTCWVIRNAL